MRTYDCPQCGGTVPFQSSVTVSATCPYCRSIVVRRDANVETMGLQAELPPDLSPLQVGTRGEFEGKSFVLVGRVRVAYDGGSWNEWCADFGEGRWGWIAEAQGFYMASFEIAVPPQFPGSPEMEATSRPESGGLRVSNFGLAVGREHMPVGRKLTLEGREFEVRDAKQTRILGAEGELPFVAVPDRAAFSADLGGDQCAFANVEYSDEGIRIFVGRYCRFEDLKFSELRAVPGWSNAPIEPTRNSTGALNCPSCGAAINLRAAGLSMTAVCPGCGTGIDTSDPKLQAIEIAGKRQSIKPAIPIGTRGKFGGVEFECIAFIRRRELSGDSWSEYLLFNPYAGFRWLVTYQGHWTLVNTLLESPPIVDEKAVHAGVTYKLFARSVADVTYVLGEVYWRMRTTERTALQDFIAPPFVLSQERYPDFSEVTWSLGEYVQPAEVQAAFKLGEPLPEPNGPYLNAPNPHREKGRSLRRWVPILLGVFLLIQWLTNVPHANQRVLEQAFVFEAGDTNRVRISKEFEIRGSRPQAVEFRTTAPVENSWVEVGYELIRADTKAVRELSQTVEFYSGYDEGYWTEGSTTSSDVLPAVEPGRYILTAELTSDPARPVDTIQVALVSGVTVWSNFVLGLLVLLVYPCYRWLREHAYERNRWSVSDFSPYQSSDSDSDD